ncbi:endonuclease/exonuclease/phosphatase family protein [Arcobacter porcinus]|uniref:Endonuclease/exonuclease/phosphatase n=1 Tax=Arcobacter porcinus TaxID=1935204 RepID=A0A5C2HEF5_9BACT|nr:endonuclease/exonuclease/phosphatase family protein [Arcobacter porcinus]OCL94384.1 Endonuclease/Exonuclease/phosphatase family protein [Aliarcobacter thereius]QEP41269.1 endonuclease/exonuclease/phosphatase [Arcobacter porcinus]
MNLKLATFNLFQFCEPSFSFYTKKEKFKSDEWAKKISFVKEQINKMNPDIIGFQEVFSQDELKNLCFECGFKYFVVSELPKLDEKINTYKSTTLALASKFPIKKVEKVNKKDDFFFARVPIKTIISLREDLEITVYVAHLKSNRLNEFEYKFTSQTSFEEKKQKLETAYKNNFSNSLKQRINEAKALHFDIKKEKNPAVLLCDLNDREFSVTIEALCNQRFYKKESKKDEYILFDTYNLAPKNIYNPHPEFKGFVRTPTSYFIGYGNTLDFIFVNKLLKNRVKSFKIFDEHLQKNKNGTLITSDHAQVVCEIELN